MVFDSSSYKALVRCQETAQCLCFGDKMDVHARHHKLPTPNAQLRKGHEQHRADIRRHMYAQWADTLVRELSLTLLWKQQVIPQKGDLKSTAAQPQEQ